jgi:hypothetical protein
VHGGLGGKHLLEELKTIISNLGREEMESVEKQLSPFFIFIFLLAQYL